jgi:hypothetical protein
VSEQSTSADDCLTGTRRARAHRCKTPPTHAGMVVLKSSGTFKAHVPRMSQITAACFIYSRLCCLRNRPLKGGSPPSSRGLPSLIYIAEIISNGNGPLVSTRFDAVFRQFFRPEDAVAVEFCRFYYAVSRLLTVSSEHVLYVKKIFNSVAFLTCEFLTKGFP